MMHFALQWLYATSGGGTQNDGPPVDWEKVFKHRPLRTMDEAIGCKMPVLQEWLEHPTLDEYWRPVYMQPEDFQKIQIPILMMTGLFDADQPGALFAWKSVEAHAPASEDRYLIIGPWTHGQSGFGGEAEAGDRRFPANSIIDFNALTLAFLEKYLKGSTSSFDHPKVKLYFTGSNVWREFPQYPASDVQTLDLFLASQGAANSANGNGTLGMSPPSNENESDSFVYDPENPVVQHDPDPVTSLTIEFGVSENRSDIQQRNDVLVYTSPPLELQLDIVGGVEVEFYASSDATDTDFTASLTDVGPDGEAISLGYLPTGIVRARHRTGKGEQSLLEPGRPYQFKIDLGHISHTFLPGHRIRLEISSSAFPFFHPNPNTGNPIADDVESRKARQSVYHTRTMPAVLRMKTLSDAAGVFRT